MSRYGAAMTGRWLCGVLAGVAVAVTLAPGRAAAEPDLRLHHAPPRLKMRTAAVKPAEPVRTAEAAPSAAGDPAAGAAPELTGFSALPTSTRDLADRVAFRLRAGVARRLPPVELPVRRRRHARDAQRPGRARRRHRPADRDQGRLRRVGQR
jgi:hypothetical protein